MLETEDDDNFHDGDESETMETATDDLPPSSCFVCLGDCEPGTGRSDQNSQLFVESLLRHLEINYSHGDSDNRRGYLKQLCLQCLEEVGDDFLCLLKLWERTKLKLSRCLERIKDKIKEVDNPEEPNKEMEEVHRLRREVVNKCNNYTIS